jgi:uncharacterized protein
MKIEKVQIKTENNTVLKAMLLRNENHKSKHFPFLVIHGWTSSMARYPERVAPEVEIGYQALLFDMRGHGMTGGDLSKLTIKDHFNDVLAAYDYLLSLENIKKENISVFGSSYGGYLAALLTAERKVNNLVLNVPALYPDIIFDKHKQRSESTNEFRRVVRGKNESRALKAVADFKGKILFIQAEKDELLPKSVMESYKKAAKSDYSFVEIKGANHSMTAPKTAEERNRIMAKWFKKLHK